MHTPAPPEAVQDDEIDPLDAYFMSIQQDAASQSNLSQNSENDENNQNNVISFEEIQNMNNNNESHNYSVSNMDSDDDAMDIEKPSNLTKSLALNDDKYYKEFIAKFNKHKAADTKEVYFDDDDDNKFIEQFESNRQQDDDYLEKQKKATEKRELLLSSKMQQRGKQEHFEKNFYVVPKEIDDMTEAEVDKYRKKMGDVSVRGVQ